MPVVFSCVAFVLWASCTFASRRFVTLPLEVRQYTHLVKARLRLPAILPCEHVLGSSASPGDIARLSSAV